VRASIDLSGVEHSRRGRLNSHYLAGIDYAVGSARDAGLNVLLELDRTPYWASADPGKHSNRSGRSYNPYYRYANDSDYAAIASAVVSRYSRAGVHAYEVWNEPNNSRFWPSGPNAAEYTSLLKAAYPAIKAADPGATVLSAGLMNLTSYEFLQGMYDAGARGSYDAQSFHIYPTDPNRCGNRDSSGRPSARSFCLLDGLRAEMTANADFTPVWVTEIGWSACTSPLYCVSSSEQAAYLTSALRLLDDGQYPYVQNTLIYQIRDNPCLTLSSDWESRLGMLTVDFGVRPSYTALQRVTGAPLLTRASRRGRVRTGASLCSARAGS
jgi:polysaccharide biosynthesis protein PslG